MIVVFFGPPGAGKGTIAAKLSQTRGVPHISTGDLFREAVRNKTELGRKVESIMASGALVPDDVTIALVRERLDRPDVKDGGILDGFPRTVFQADALAGFCTVDLVINFEIDDAKIVERLSGRRVCRANGHTFHVRFMPPAKAGVCDICGSELYQRDDDSEASIKKRLSVYREQTSPLIDYYREKGSLRDIDAAPSVDEVFQSVLRLVPAQA